MKVGDLVRLNFETPAIDNAIAMILCKRDWYGSEVLDIIVASGDSTGEEFPVAEMYVEVISES